MTQKMQTRCSTTYSDQSLVDDMIHERPVAETPFDESIESAFTRLQDILASKASAEAELEDLFAKRRNHAVEELEKARRRLEFVNDEEKRMKRLVVGECFRSTQV
jgi:aminoglycoside phosphotransferase